MPNTAPIWIHAGDPSQQRSAAYLADRICSQTGSHVRLSASDPWMASIALSAQIKFRPNITDAMTLCTDAYTVPRASVVWLGSPDFAAMPTLKDGRNMQWLWANIQPDFIPQRRLRIFTTHSERLLREIDQFFVYDDIAAERLIRAGIEDDRVAILGRLQSSVAVPNILGDEDEFNTLQGRSIWTALFVDAAELGAVINAQKMILRESHRMLMILVPKDPRDEEDFATILQDSGLKTARRVLDETPDNNTAVFLADGPDEYARWLSMSPVAFLGHSLDSGARGSDPYSAASMGVAILYGPAISDYLEDYGHLAKAGAARIIRDGDSLATAVLQISNPQTAAQMGFAAWDFISSGAEATDAVIKAILTYQEA